MFCYRKYYKKKVWIQDIGGQFCSRILMIFAKDVIVVKKLEVKNKRFDQVGNYTFRITFYEVGSRFYRSNQTNNNTNRKQIYFGSYRLCNQVVEVKALITNIVVVTTRFLYEYILARFGCPLTMVTYQEVHFINDKIKHLTK
jgi:hypothetical protein